MMRSAAKAKVHVTKKAADVENINDAQIRRARRDLESRPALRQAYEKLRSVVHDLATQDARRKYAIGVVVLRAREDSKKYGKRSVQTLAILLGYDKSTLHDFADVAETWKTAAQFAAVLRRRNALGLTLTFSHLVTVKTCTDEKEREHFLERALNESLTVKQLDLIVQGQDVKPERSDGGEEPAEVLDVRRMAAAWSGEIDQLKRKTTWVIQRATSNPGPLVLKELESCAEQQHAFAAQAVANAEALEAALAELGGKKKKRE